MDVNSNSNHLSMPIKDMRYNFFTENEIIALDENYWFGSDSIRSLSERIYSTNEEVGF